MQLKLNTNSSLTIKDLFNYYLNLSKIRITVSVTITCLIGYILFSSSLTYLLFFAVLGTFLLSAGSSALNHFQEIEYDALMPRTANRPMASNKISSTHGLVFGLIIALVGYLILFYGVNELSAYLGLSALVIYNGIYTPLKRKTTLAVFPGAIIGAIPPMIGWVAAGGSIMDIQILALAFFIFFWQIPHFWLLVLIYEEDYKMAGYPTLTELIDLQQLKRVTFIWIFNLAVCSIIFPFFRLTESIIVNIIFLVSGSYMIWGSRNLLQVEYDKKLIKKTFMRVNLFVLIVLITLIVEKLVK